MTDVLKPFISIKTNKNATFQIRILSWTSKKTIIQYCGLVVLFVTNVSCLKNIQKICLLFLIMTCQLLRDSADAVGGLKGLE